MIFKNKKDKDFYSQSRNIEENLGQKLRKLFSGKFISEDEIQELEEILIKSDIGPGTSRLLIEILRKKSIKNIEDAIIILKNEIKNYLKEGNLDIEKGILNVLLILGVNGAGKTTTIAKLGNYFLKKDYRIIFAAGDTFRAAAAEQLSQWAERLNIPIIKQKENADPSSVVFDAIDSAKSKKADILIIDTAGRFHNKQNLIEELKKINRIIEKKGPLMKKNILVLDATTGQNAYQQAQTFNEAVGIDGLVITKLDSQSKAGIIVNIQKSLGLLFYFIGNGEKLKI